MGNAGSCTKLVARILWSDPEIKQWASISNDDSGQHGNRANDGGPSLFKCLADDSFLKNMYNKIVWKHDGGMGTPQSLEVISKKIRRGDYDIFWVFLIRRPSKYELRGYEQPLRIYMESVKPGDKYIIWDSSLMFLDPDNFLEEMGKVLELDLSGAEAIQNVDLKWMQQAREYDVAI
jgi:hypothetical protein